MVRDENGPGRAAATNASMSGMSSSTSGTTWSSGLAPGAGAGRSRPSGTPTIWTPELDHDTDQPSGGATSPSSVVTTATDSPGPVRMARSAQSAGVGGPSKPANGETSGTNFAALPLV